MRDVAPERFVKACEEAAWSVRRVLALHAQFRSREDREDLLQEVWIRAYRSFNTIEEKRFVAWCCRVAQRLCLDSYRRDSSRVKTTTLDELISSPSLICHEPSALDQILDEESRQALADCFSHLSEDHRQALLLRSDGHSYDEIAALQGATPGAVRARIFRVRTEAKTLLKPERN